MSYNPVTDRPATAKEYWDRYSRKTDLLSMLDFAELYADYICDYEKTYDYQRKR